jgi:hypothetical protein
MTKAVTLYRPASQGLATKDRTSSAADAINALVRRAAAGDLTPRRAKRLTVVLQHAARITESIIQIAEECDRMAVDAAVSAREVAQCEADIAAFDALRAEAEERATHAAAVVRKESRVRELIADVQAEEFELRLAALRAEKARSEAPAVPPIAQQRRPTVQTPDEREVLLERVEAEAARIVREVQAGSVPTGSKHPYHAFAGCLYMQAKLDGHAARLAASFAQRELVSQMLTGSELTPAQITALGREYLALKKRVDGAADVRKNAAVLDALSRFGAAPTSSNGEGIQ